jgi:hypothetical protein
MNTTKLSKNRLARVLKGALDLLESERGSRSKCRRTERAA